MKLPLRIRRETWEQLCDLLDIPRTSDVDVVFREVAEHVNRSTDAVIKLEEENNMLGGEVKDLECEIDDLEVDLDDTEKQLDLANQEIEQKETRIAELEKRIAELENEER